MITLISITNSWTGFGSYSSKRTVGLGPNSNIPNANNSIWDKKKSPEKSPEEIMDYERTKPYTFTQKRNLWLNTSRNCIVLVPGMRLSSPASGFSMIIFESSVKAEFKNSEREGGLAAGGLNYLIRLANGQFTVDPKVQAERFFNCKDTNTAVIKALRAMGMNMNRVFYINGTAFEVVDGFIVPYDLEPLSLAEAFALAKASYKEKMANEGLIISGGEQECDDTGLLQPRQSAQILHK